MKKGTLYLVATPIGNLGDMTLRALDTLKSVDCVAAEDTRRVRKLLTYFSISVPVMSYHDHVERKKAGNVIARLKEGKSIALVSDSGTPLISDPGFTLLQRALEEGIEVVPIPGPSACISALIISGLAVDRFVFEGYPSRSPSKRRKKLRTLVDEERTMIFYESPHRILKMLADVETILGNRTIAVVRELTKKYEEHFRGTVREAHDHFSQKDIKGEFVVVVEGKTNS